jgi:hypothetical protein
MIKIPTWARGPYELIEHAEGHYNREGDFDRRMALISFDNAIEVAITTYLQLHPKLRGGATYQKEHVNKWLENYHRKIEFLDLFVKESTIKIESSTQDIIFFHILRNELYHSGNGFVPECCHIDSIRHSAIEVYNVLFGVDVVPLLNASESIVAYAEQDTQNLVTINNRFLGTYIAFERALRSTITAMGVDSGSQARGISRLWETFTQQAGEQAKKFERTVNDARQVRNQLVHTGITDVPEEELEIIASSLNGLVDFLLSFGFSYNMLPTLIERYGDWIKPEITNLRIIHKDKRSFFEVTNRQGKILDEMVQRIDLDFIGSENKPLFSPEFCAQVNADRFFDDLDLYSILMTGLGELIFTQAGIEEAVKLCGAKSGNPVTITRRPKN